MRSLCTRYARRNYRRANYMLVMRFAYSGNASTAIKRLKERVAGSFWWPTYPARMPDRRSYMRVFAKFSHTDASTKLVSFVEDTRAHFCEIEVKNFAGKMSNTYVRLVNILVSSTRWEILHYGWKTEILCSLDVPILLLHCNNLQCKEESVQRNK